MNLYLDLLLGQICLKRRTCLISQSVNIRSRGASGDNLSVEIKLLLLYLSLIIQLEQSYNTTKKKRIIEEYVLYGASDPITQTMPSTASLVSEMIPFEAARGQLEWWDKDQTSRERDGDKRQCSNVRRCDAMKR